MMRPQRMPTPSLELTTPWICWPVSSGFLPSTWLVAIGRCHCLRKLESKRRSRHILAYSNFELCRRYNILWIDLTNLTLIFERLRSYRLQLKSTKCHLFRSSVPFLGHIVSRHGLECDPAKIEDVKSWPVPDCLKIYVNSWDLSVIIDASSLILLMWRPRW